MGFGVFRRRPDYEKKFRSVFPTRIPGGGPPAGPWQKFLPRVPGFGFFARPVHYSAFIAAKRLPLGVTAVATPVSQPIRQHPVPLPGVFAREYDYQAHKTLRRIPLRLSVATPVTQPKRQHAVFVREHDYEIQRAAVRRLPLFAVATVAVVQQHSLRPPYRPEAFTRDTDYEVNRLIRRMLPPTLAGGGPPSGPWLKHLHPLPAPRVFVRRNDYETNRTIRRVFPSVPFVASFAIVPRLKALMFQPDELWRYQVRRFLPPKAILGVVAVVPGAQLYEHDCIHVARYGAARFGFARFGFAPHDVNMDGAIAFYAWCKDGKEDESNWKLASISAWKDGKDQETDAALVATADVVVADEEGIHTARFGTARFGVARFGFVPDDVILDGTDTFYSWVKEKKPTDDGWSSVRSVDEE